VALTTDDAALVINDQLAIPRSEITVRVSRSSGAGGQHVNKTSSRVELTWNVDTSSVVSDEQREILRTRLASRLTEDGTLRVVSSETRSQRQNRTIAEERLAETIRKALTPRKKRKPTRRPKSADEARLASKKRHSDKKRERRRDVAD
jgi:ribosome-associated protein